MKKENINIKNIELQTSLSEVFLDAVDFFEGAGCKFINSKHDHRYSLSILIDDSLKRVTVITPFSFAMSRNTLAGLYVALIKGERFGGKRRIQSLIKVINNLIRDNYKRGSKISFNIETGKYRLKSTEVLKILADITERALTYSLGGDRIEHIGDIYAYLGGEVGTYHFFREVILATEASIPNFDDGAIVIGHIPDIKCYCCKHCKCDKNGVRTCDKVCTSITGKDYDAHPGRYTDAHHEGECKTLMSAVIDERMDTCEDYESRIK